LPGLENEGGISTPLIDSVLLLTLTYRERIVEVFAPDVKRFDDVVGARGLVSPKSRHHDCEDLEAK
jgi:hypothetical protein